MVTEKPLSKDVRGPEKGGPHVFRASSEGNTWAWCVLLLLGLGFGAITSAVDHGFGPASAYTSKIFGGMVAWLAAGLLAAWAGRTRKQAFQRAIVFLLAAVIAYYVSDVANGTYTNSIPGVEGLAAFDLQGVIVDVAFYAIISTVTALVLGAVVGIVRRGGVAGVLASVAVPGYISYTTLRTRHNPGPDLLLGEASGWMAWLAIGVTAFLLVIGVYRLVNSKATQRESARSRSSL